MLEDLRANSWSLRPCCMVLAYRVAHFCSVWRKKNVLNNLWAAPLLVLYRIITECLFGYEIQAAATIGRRFTIHHGYAVVINKNVVAGDDFFGGPPAVESLPLAAIVVPITWHVHILATASNSVPTLLFLVISRLVTTSPWVRAAWCSTLSRTTRWWWEKKRE